MRTRLMFILILGTLSSCFENSYLEEIPEVNLTDDFSIRRIVHTDISLGTEFRDSLVTSGRSAFLLGNYPDENRGIVKAIPYFEFTMASNSFRFEEEEEMDSLVLIVKFLNTHYDTLTRFNLKVWEITEDFEYRNDDQVFYQFETFSTGRSPITTEEVQIFPSIDSVQIKIPAEFALDLFEKGKGSTSIFLSDDDFKDELRGIKLEVDGISPLIQISKDSYLRFYFQDRKEGNRTNESFDIPVGEFSKGYTYLESDRSISIFKNGLLETLLPASETDGVTLVDELGLAGTSIAINGLSSYAEQTSEYYIAEASLFLPVRRNTYSSNFNPPASKLDVYLKRESGQFQSYISQSNLTSLDYIYQEATYFRIPLVDLIDRQIRGENPDASLWIEIMPDSVLSASYLILGENSTSHKTRLEITLIPLK